METITEEPISTDDPLNNIQFSDIFNLEEIQHLQDLFSDTNGVASIITTPDGIPITKPSNFTRLCSNIIRKTEKGLSNCYKSDAAIGNQNSSGPIIQPCMSCGLWDAGASITVGGKHIANWLIGQVLNDNASEQTMMQYADEIGANRTDFLEALHEVPVISAEKFNNVAKLLFAFANELSEKAYNNQRLKIQITEKEKANEFLIESEERFQLLFNKAPLSYQSLDINGHFIEVNQHWLDTFGYTREEVIGKWFGDFLAPAYKSEARMRFQIFKLLGRIHSEYEMIHKNGNLLLVAFDGKIGHDLNGKFKQTHGILQDITERKHAEQALKESELKYRELVENSPDAIVIYAEDKIVMVNKEGLYLTAAIRTDELIGKPVIQFVHPDYLEFVNVRMKELTNDGDVLPLAEEKFIRLDGSEVEVDVKAMSVRIDNKPAVQLIIRDITERKQIENELQRKNTLLKLTGETAQIGGWEFDTETKMLHWTEEVYRIHEVDFAFNPNVSDGINFYAPTSRPAIKDALNMAIEYGEPFDLELELITKKGNHRWVHSIGKSYQENGKTKKVYGSFQDITERKRVELEIQNKNEELQKLNAEKDKFFSIIAHDLRSPLCGFMGLTELLVDDALKDSPEEFHKLALAMKNSAANVFRILGNLLEWSRMQRGLTDFVPELLLLNSVISESLIQISEDAIKKDITIDFEIPGDLSVFSDKNMLDSILRNLVSNAVKFTPRGGRITFSAQSVSGKMVEISIIDTGIGMNKEMITNLFRLDANTNRKGTEGEYSTGLGLVICKDFIEKQGGKLLIESEEGKGSIFSFSLPIMVDKEEIKEIKSIDPVEKPIHLTNKEFSGLKILIAEDDEASEFFISHSVQKLGKEIIKVKTGIDAVEVCCNNPDIDIVLMDIKMPEMDGYEATRQIRLFNNQVVIIAETAYAQKGDREIALTAGCNDHITKPFGKFKLISLMKKHLKLKQSIYSHY